MIRAINNNPPAPGRPAPGPDEDAVDGAARELTVSFGELAVDRAAIIAAVGYHDGVMPEPFREMLDTALAEAGRRAELRAGYRLVESGRIAGRHDVLRVGGTEFATKKIVAGALGRAEQVAVFACTIGASLEEWSRAALMGDDPALGYIADAVGSGVAEALADRLHDHIEQEMGRRGWRSTNRYSPGYCGWSVAEQQGLFALLPPQFCGIELADSALMHPVKSISGFIGVGPAVRHSDYLCGTCNMRDCTYRRYHERRTARAAAASRVRRSGSADSQSIS